MEPPSASAWSSDLRLDRTDIADGSICLRVDGDVDMATGDDFDQTVMGLVGEPAVRALFLDAACLRFIDSNGVTVLVRAHRAAGQRGISFAITNVQEPVRGVLEILGVYDMLTSTCPR